MIPRPQMCYLLNVTEMNYSSLRAAQIADLWAKLIIVVISGTWFLDSLQTAIDHQNSQHNMVIKSLDIGVKQT